MTFQLAPGIEIAGRYKLERLIGKGGMGEVWSASQTLTRKHVALKFLVGEAAEDPDTRRRLVREARAACAVEHPNVVEVHDVVELEGGVPAIVMELLKGESLEQKLRAEGKLSLGETASILLRVVSAVGTAHALGIVHRDIKPDNIFLATTPEGVEVKVLDFGVAKIGSTEDGGASGALTATGTMLGTPYYMAPEQAFGEKRIDHRADIWSLGIVLFRCLSGVLPTKADNLGQILKIIMTRSIPKIGTLAPDLPADMRAMIDRMLAYSASERPADLREVKALLEKHAGVAAEDFGAPPEGEAGEEPALASTAAPVLLGSEERRSARRRGLLAVAFAIGIAGVIVTVVLSRGDRSGAPAAPAGSTVEASPEPAPSSAATVVAPPPSGTVSEVTPPPVPSVSASAKAVAPPRAGHLPPATSTPAPLVTATATSGFGGIVTKPPF